jgi:membrane protease YdiL (CAAX protease family)
MMTIFTILLSPIFSYVRLRAKSVVAAAIIHGTLNATYGISIMLIKGGDDLTVGVMGLAGFIALAVINLGLLGYDRKIAKRSMTDCSLNSIML